MRHIILSDHTGHKINEAARKRMAAHTIAEEKRRARMAPTLARGDALREKSSNALKSYRYVTWLGLKIFTGLHDFICGFILWQTIEPQAPGADEAKFSAGNYGEQMVREKLSALSDEYVLFSGYKNQKGEIDQILVGPHCVLCIEIKYTNGRIFSNGDRWWRDVYDNYSNLKKENDPIADRGGRGPSAQLNASADMLEVFLRRNGLGQKVYRAVVFSHEKSELQSIKASTVDIVTDLKSFAIFGLLNQLRRSSKVVHVPVAVAMIEKDHVFHEKKTAQYRARAALRN